MITSDLQHCNKLAGWIGSHLSLALGSRQLGAFDEPHLARGRRVWEKGV